MLTSTFNAGTLQADGRIMPEPVMAVEDVANTVVYIANLPLTTTMLEVTVL